MRVFGAVASVIFAVACNSSNPRGGGAGTSPDAGTTSSPDAGGSDAASAPDAAAAALSQTAIVFSAALDGQSATDLYVLDGATATRLTQTTGDELYPAISPDRTQIAFVRDFQLFVIDAAGRNERLVAAKTGRQRKINDFIYATTLSPAAWSPDGTQLAYPYPREPFIIVDGSDMIDESYGTTLHIVDLDGSNDHLVSSTIDRTIYSIGWYADVLSFSMADDCPDCAGGELVGAIKPDGSGYREFNYQLDSGRGSPNKQVDWSPDGTKWVFVIASQHGNYDAPGTTYTSTAAVDDETLLVSASSWSPRWSPDGTEIAFIGSDGIYVIAGVGDTPRRVLAATGLRGIDW
jgi:Tol biopolymer transport system component